MSVFCKNRKTLRSYNMSKPHLSSKTANFEKPKGLAKQKVVTQSGTLPSSRSSCVSSYPLLRLDPHTKVSFDVCSNLEVVACSKEAIHFLSPQLSSSSSSSLFIMSFSSPQCAYLHIVPVPKNITWTVKTTTTVQHVQQHECHISGESHHRHRHCCSSRCFCCPVSLPFLHRKCVL